MQKNNEAVGVVLMVILTLPVAQTTGPWLSIIKL
jgi:hypothetical protein